MVNYYSGPFGALGDLLKYINRMSEDSEVHCTYRTSGDWCTSMAYIFQFCFLLVLPNKVLFSPESHKMGNFLLTDEFSKITLFIFFCTELHDKLLIWTIWSIG